MIAGFHFLSTQQVELNEIGDVGGSSYDGGNIGGAAIIQTCSSNAELKLLHTTRQSHYN